MIRMKKWMIWSGAGIAVSALSLTTLVRVVADDTKSKTSARNSNVLYNAPEFNRKTTGAALDNRILSDNLMYNEKSGGFAVTQIKSLELSKLDGSNEKLEYKARAEKKAHGKSPKGGHSKTNVPGDSVSDEHAAKLKAESEANGVAPTGLTEKTLSPLSTVASKRIAKLKAEAEWLGKKNSSDNPNAGVQKSVSIPDQHSAKLDAEAKSKP